MVSWLIFNGVVRKKKNTHTQPSTHSDLTFMTFLFLKAQADRSIAVTASILLYEVSLPQFGSQLTLVPSHPSWSSMASHLNAIQFHFIQ